MCTARKLSSDMTCRCGWLKETAWMGFQLAWVQICNVAAARVDKCIAYSNPMTSSSSSTLCTPQGPQCFSSFGGVFFTVRLTSFTSFLSTSGRPQVPVSKMRNMLWDFFISMQSQKSLGMCRGATYQSWLDRRATRLVWVPSGTSEHFVVPPRRSGYWTVQSSSWFGCCWDRVDDCVWDGDGWLRSQRCLVCQRLGVSLMLVWLMVVVSSLMKSRWLWEQG